MQSSDVQNSIETPLEITELVELFKKQTITYNECCSSYEAGKNTMAKLTAMLSQLGISTPTPNLDSKKKRKYTKRQPVDASDASQPEYYAGRIVEKRKRTSSDATSLSSETVSSDSDGAESDSVKAAPKEKAVKAPKEKAVKTPKAPKEKAVKAPKEKAVKDSNKSNTVSQSNGDDSNVNEEWNCELPPTPPQSETNSIISNYLFTVKQLEIKQLEDADEDAVSGDDDDDGLDVVEKLWMNKKYLVEESSGDIYDIDSEKLIPGKHWDGFNIIMK